MVNNIAFPTAAIVREMKKDIPDKMISQKVKIAMNQFVSDLTELMARDMSDKCESVIYEHAFVRASRPYVCAAHLSEEHDEVINDLERIRMRFDEVVRNFRVKFEIPDEDDFKVGGDEKIEEPLFE